jgi:large subunit ribosomal protein L5
LSTAREKTVPRIRMDYLQRVVPALMGKHGLGNPMQVPKLDKIVVNIGIGKALADPKLIDEAQQVLRAITGQKPVVTRAKKAISNFKLRKGVAIGCKVTLRGVRMYEFFDRLVSITIPRIRDFRGLSRKSFDGAGNYTLGIKEQIVFLEVDRDKVSQVSGLDLCICTTAGNNELGLSLLQEMGMPFRNN